MTALARLLSSKTDEWITQPGVLDVIRETAPIVLDPCANPIGFVRAMLEIVYPDDDGLTIDWRGLLDAAGVDPDQHWIFVNPPYSNLRAWLAKCREQAERGCLVLGLVPARVEAAAFQDHVTGRSWRYEFRGRLNFHRAIETEYEAELSKVKPRAKRLQAIEDAAAAGARTYVSDSATFATVAVMWDQYFPGYDPPLECPSRRLRELLADGPSGRWVR